MSMAGGWFFLTVNEAFTLGDRDFRLPGVGLLHGGGDREGRQGARWLGDRRDGGDDRRRRPAPLEAARRLVRSASARRGLGSTDEPRSWVLELLRRSPLLRRMRQARAGSPRRGRRARRATRERGRRRPGSGRGRRAPSRRTLGLAAAAAAAGAAWACGGSCISSASVSRARVAAPRGRPRRDVRCGRPARSPSRPPGPSRPASSIGRSATWSRRLQPIVQLVASFPAPMLFPLVTAAMLGAARAVPDHRLGPDAPRRAVVRALQRPRRRERRAARTSRRRPTTTASRGRRAGRRSSCRPSSLPRDGPHHGGGRRLERVDRGRDARVPGEDPRDLRPRLD